MRSFHSDAIPSTATSRRSAPALWIACLALLSTAPATAAADAAKPHNAPDDQTITDAVERAMQFETSVPANTITVATNQGIVTLTGKVDDLLAKERVAKVVQQVRGVRSIVNQIRADPEQRPDAEIQRDVKDALRYDTATESREITPSVKDGVVTLSGTVQSWQERRLAVHAAKGVRGVREVTDSLRVAVPKERPDVEIQADVEGALTLNPWVDADRVRVSIARGTVRLDGSVSSLAQKHVAEGLAWVEGTRAVDTSGLSVDSWAEAPLQRKGPAARSDDEIQSAVEAALRQDPRVSGGRATVRVDRGMITLAGVVDSLRAEKAAESDARNTVGVQRVFNYLKVRASEHGTDEDLSRTISAALTRSPVTDDLGISVKAKNGKVWLTGSVDTFFEKSEAERIAQGAAGVSAVYNRLQVQLPEQTYHDYVYDPLWDYDPFYRGDRHAFGSDARPYASDQQIQSDIKDELFWSPFVDGDDVEVSVRNGVATLSGTVEDWSEYRAAADNAYEGGALFVVNHLKVGPSVGS